MSATAGAQSATVNWTAPATGGVTKYTITPYIGTTAQTPTTITGNPPATSATVTGLTAGNGLHLHRAGLQLQRRRSRVGGIQLGHPDRAGHARGADQRQRQPRDHAGAGQLDGRGLPTEARSPRTR